MTDGDFPIGERGDLPERLVRCRGCGWFCEPADVGQADGQRVTVPLCRSCVQVLIAAWVGPERKETG